MKEQVYLMLLITPDFTIKRVFRNPALAIRTASKIRRDYNAVKWISINHGHKSETGTLFLTIQPLELE